jgi:hypothetical protein
MVYLEKVRTQFLSLRQPDFRTYNSPAYTAEISAVFADVFGLENAVGARHWP